MTTIGWIGLGNMGLPMATNLLIAGYPINIYNRTKEKADFLLEKGANFCSSPRELAKESDIVITMLSDGKALKEVYEGPEGILAGMKKNQIVVDMSTVSPAESSMICSQIYQNGASFLDAPVSGSVGPAVEGKLVILVGGPSNILSICQPVFEVLGKKTIHFGDNGSGTRAKLVINLLLGITVQGISETLLFGEKMELDMNQILEMIEESAVSTPLLKSKKEMYLHERFPASFALKWMSKDLGLAMAEAKQRDVDLPLAGRASDTFLAAKVSGKGELDVTAVYTQLKETVSIAQSHK